MLQMREQVHLFAGLTRRFNYLPQTFALVRVLYIIHTYVRHREHIPPYAILKTRRSQILQISHMRASSPVEDASYYGSGARLEIEHLMR